MQNFMMRRVMVASYIHAWVVGILHVACQRGQSKVPEEIVQIPEHDLRIHHQ
jgi:hypothetical protein